MENTNQQTTIEETKTAEESTQQADTKEETKQSSLINLDNLTSADLERLYAENEIVKQYIDKQKDSHFSKSLKTWKQNNLAAEVEKEIAKRFPAETPEQKRIRELEQQMINMQKAQTLEKMTNKALTALAEKGLPVELAELVVAEDENKTMKAINALSEIYSKSVQAEVEKKFKENGRTPGRAGQELSAYNSARKSGNVKDMIKAKANLQ